MCENFPYMCKFSVVLHVVLLLSYVKYREYHINTHQYIVQCHSDIQYSFGQITQSSSLNDGVQTTSIYIKLRSARCTLNFNE